MAHSYVACYTHYIFSTKQRRRIITPDLMDRLWAYVGGIARDNRMKPIVVGGTDDHAHVLVRLPSTLSVPRAFR